MDIFFTEISLIIPTVHSGEQIAKTRKKVQKILIGLLNIEIVLHPY